MTGGGTFAGIVGHGAIVSRLACALATDRPAHAYLFHGPEGVGKRTLARAFVQGLFCSARVGGWGDGVAGCGVCPSCRKSAAGNHPDLMVLELLEKKVRISVEQVRELTRFVAFTPLESVWKAAIVDDASLMNDAAANALLKTLEEPPPGSVLILITRQPGLLLPTLRSRCLKERFLPLAGEEILTMLERIGGEAGVEERREAARLAAGSVGVALRLSQKGALATRSAFFGDLESLPRGGLAEVLELAGNWSQAERFSLVPELLETWFAERIRDSVTGRRGLEVDPARWLEAASRAGRLAREVQIFNLNPRLTLEALFIRLARLQGAGF